MHSIGDVVVHEDRSGLHCGTGVYQAAIVICNDPFVLASEDGDMIWYHIDPYKVRSVWHAGTAKVRKIRKQRPDWEKK